MERRQFLTGAIATRLSNINAPFIKGDGTLCDKDALCLCRANEIREIMREMHGGAWSVSIAKDFVLISRQYASQSSAGR